VKRLLLVGGGHAHVEVLRRFALEPEPGIALTLLSPHRYTPYSGMLPGLVARHYRFEDAHIDLEPLAARAQATFVAARATALDAAAHRVACDDGTTVAFDVCSLDIGSTPDASASGAREHAVAVKPVDRFLERWQAEIERSKSKTRALERVAVVGGGAGGLEMLLAMQHAAHVGLAAANALDQMPEFHLLTDTGTILPTHSPAARQRLARVLDTRGVVVHTDTKVVRVDAGSLHAANGNVVVADFIVWATSAAAAPWVRASGLAVDDRGFMCVDANLESTSHPDIFGAGDIASLVGTKLPKSGVFAVRKGPFLAHNLRAALRGEPRQPFVTTPTALSLITTGDKSAVMSWHGLSISGPLVWRWKDWIDRRFMAKYRS